MWSIVLVSVCFQAEDGIRDLVRSRGLGDVYKRQALQQQPADVLATRMQPESRGQLLGAFEVFTQAFACLLYTSDAADERSSVDLGGRRIIKKKKPQTVSRAGSLKKQETEVRY